jgi:TDG/mug DNA glycosylase family protein
MAGGSDSDLVTLPDLLRDGLAVVFVGINPSIFAAKQGHYFARRSNRFWPALSRSTLGDAARRRIGVERLEPMHDRALLECGFGFTDLVKRPTENVSKLAPTELAAGVADLVRKLERFAPRLACFHGLTGFRYVHAALFADEPKPVLGLQPGRIGRTGLFVVPHPSAANAHFTLADQIRWYDALAACLDGAPA